MKCLIAIVCCAMVGCAQVPPPYYRLGTQSQYPARGILTQQDLDLMARKVSNKDCVAIDANIYMLEQQLKYRNLYNRVPEDLTDDDRKYNATAKTIIWALRIGCNNPTRYQS